MRLPTAIGGGVSSIFRAENSVVNRVFTRVTLISAIFETDSSVGATPSFSVDTKKRELVGDFKNPGMRWDLSRRPGDCGKLYGPSEIAA
jgi:hypothetical protein